MLQRHFIFLFLLFCSGISSAQTRYDQLYIFGDSLSDTGNLASATIDFPFPFFQNRISDGPLLVDFLAAELGLEARASEVNGGNNFSVAGGNILGGDVEDLNAQVNSFLGRRLDNSDGVPENNSLYFVMMGGNDLRDIRSVLATADARTQINLVLDQLEFQLNRLYDAGARAFIVANVPNIGRIPETLARQSNDPGVASRAESYVRIFNSGLSQRLGVFAQKAGVTLNLFDLFSESEQLINNASEFGFTQTQVGCFRLENFEFQPECEFGRRFDRFIFFDSIHPTSKSNRIVSAALIEQIPVLDIDLEPTDPEPTMVVISTIIGLLLLD